MRAGPGDLRVPADGLPLQGHVVDDCGFGRLDELRQPSFRLNDEANLNVYDSDFALEQVRHLREDKKKSRRVTYECWRNRPWKENSRSVPPGLSDRSSDFRCSEHL